MQKEVLFAHFPKVTHQRYQSLIHLCGSLEDAWTASPKVLSKLPWKKAVIEAFITWRKNVSEKRLSAVLTQEDIHCVSQSDPAYPPLLRDLYDPPLCLFVRGSLLSLHQPLAVVGPRKYSSYGKYIAEQFVHYLAQRDMTIVSGLAMGIDALAHQATLDAGGKTVAVLGGGIDRATLHPRLHTRLAETIIEHDGAIISEFPPGTTPTTFSFPKRNRIIAGLSLGTFVVEAGKKSGALITAQCSLDIGRDVFTVPQNITSTTSEGTNTLLQQGAHLILEPHDILSALHIDEMVPETKIPKSAQMTEEEQFLLKHLSRDPMHVDMLAKKMSMTSAALTSALTLLELRGRVKNLGNMTYILIS